MQNRKRKEAQEFTKNLLAEFEKLDMEVGVLKSRLAALESHLRCQGRIDKRVTQRKALGRRAADIIVNVSSLIRSARELEYYLYKAIAAPVLMGVPTEDDEAWLRRQLGTLEVPKGWDD